MRAGPVVLTVVLVLAGCSAAKKKSTSSTVMASVDGPIVASLVRVEKVGLGIGGAGGGHVGILYPTLDKQSACVLRVTKPAEVEVALHHRCEGAELLVDPSGTRLAVGVPGAPHRLFYFGAKGRSFEAPKPLDAVIKWEDVPDLAAALPAIFARAMETEDSSLRFMLSGGKGPAPSFGMPIVDEVLEGPDGGPRLAKMLTASAASPFHPDHRTTKYRELWRRAFERLIPADAAAVRTTLAAVARSPNPDENALARALHEDALDWSRPEHDPILLARTGDLVRAKQRGRTGDDVLSVLFRRLVQTRPGPTAAIACEYLAAWSPEDVLGATIADDAGAAALALAVTKTRCEAVEKHFAEAVAKEGYGLCTVGAWFCPESEDRTVARKRCDTRELEARARAALVPWSSLKEKLGTIEHLYVPGLVYARVLAKGPPIPGDVEKAVARQTYAWSLPQTPKCPAAAPAQRCAPDWNMVTHLEVCRPDERVDLGYDRRDGILRYDDTRHERWVEGDPAADAGTRRGHSR